MHIIQYEIPSTTVLNTRMVIIYIYIYIYTHAHITIYTYIPPYHFTNMAFIYIYKFTYM